MEAQKTNIRGTWNTGKRRSSLVEKENRGNIPMVKARLSETDLGT